MRGIINIISGFFPPVANALVGLVLTPLILSRLGMEAYSYWPLCNSLTLYVGLVTISLGPGLRRHTVFALDQGNIEEAKEYFNTGLALTIGFWILLLLVSILICILFPYFIYIKPAFRREVQLMFFFTALAASLEVFTMVFFVGAYARDKLYMERVARLISPLARFLVIWIAFSIWPPSIEMLGIAALTGSVLTLAIAIITYLWYLPELGLKLKRYFARKAMRTLAGFSSWILVAVLGDFAFRNLHLILANRLFDPLAAGRYGIVLQVASMLTLVSSHIGYVLSRKVISALSSNTSDEAGKMLASYYSWTMCGLAMPLAILFINADLLFSLWLRDYSVELVRLFRVVIVATFIAEPMSMVNTYLLASNRLSTNGIATFLMAPGLLYISLPLLNMFHLGLVSVAIASGIVILLRNITLMIDAYCKCNMNLKDMLQGLCFSIISFVVVLSGCHARRLILITSSLPNLVLDIFTGLILWAMVYLLLSKEMRNTMQYIIRITMSKHKLVKSTIG